MKPFIRFVYHSFPFQLLILHIKKFPVLLLFWYILFSTISSGFMKSYGAYSLFLGPEYLGSVNPLGAAIVGVAIGIFIMSWHITTFILFSRHFRFLATTSNPFLKYCINNSALPAVFLVYYIIRMSIYDSGNELMSAGDVTLQVLGFLAGILFLILISFLYFFRYDRRIARNLSPVISNPQLFKSQFKKKHVKLNDSRVIQVDWFFRGPFTIKKVRDVSHYSDDFIESVLKRHHFASVVAVFIAFIFLVVVGYFLDYKAFQLPAAAGITVFFAIVIAVIGAFTYFTQSWSIPLLLLLFFLINLLFKFDIIDPTNKAYGINYANKKERPDYSPEYLAALCSDSIVFSDRRNMEALLDRWKAKQKDSLPLLYIINTSGGGNRSARFTMEVLQHLDSVSNGTILRKTVLINGASGGMLGASYFRELDLQRQKGLLKNITDPVYADNISQDLLNPIFSSWVARDIAAPAQKFKIGSFQYLKDRGYAFEEKLNENAGGLFNKSIRDYKELESKAESPMVVYNTVVSRDGRKFLIGTQPMSFLMKANVDDSPDAIDFNAFFKYQSPDQLRVLSAMRMNATFPYVLPNVWLPSNPVIDVMDAGLRDNYGMETSYRFLTAMRPWIEKNCRGIVLIQIRDRKTGGWDHPFESGNISEVLTRPFLLLQNNWYKMQEYNQTDLFQSEQQLFKGKIHKITFQYNAQTEESGAALSFHLTKREQQDITKSLHLKMNQEALSYFAKLSDN